jgi:hypothetical protein
MVRFGETTPPQVYPLFWWYLPAPPANTTRIRMFLGGPASLQTSHSAGEIIYKREELNGLHKPYNYSMARRQDSVSLNLHAACAEMVS